MKKLILLLVLSYSSMAFSQQISTKFEKSNGTQTPSYSEIIDWWKNLDRISDKVFMKPMGMTDANLPLHLILLNNEHDFNLESIRKKNKRIIFINNGIHPGEPDGIDASMLLARDIVSKKLKLPENIVLAIIPVYNIGGCLNRSPFFRVDQNGPEEFGFRGNSQNLDLNRDFIKSDSREAKAFAEIFQMLDPDVFIDNHVSNGADYQHIITLISSQHNKLGGVMGSFMIKSFEPGIYKLMKEKNYDLIPYVNYFGITPENGWTEFWDSPRYSSGYASIFSTFAFVPETHMLKPYADRVKATYELMLSFIQFTSANSNKIKELRKEQKESIAKQTQFPLKWKIDSTGFDNRLYKGFKSGYKASEVSGLSRLYYDRSEPYDKTINFYNQYKASSFIERPKAYIIPQGWNNVIGLLKINKVKMTPLSKDSIVEVETYKIEKYTATPRPYESHHPNRDIEVSKSIQKILFKKGDYLIPMNQVANRFLMEVLEPEAEDSYFSWNFFDGILGQKEGYSAYVFEETAAAYLKSNPDLKTKLEQRRQSDSVFAKSASAQLNFVYQNSPYVEAAFNRYPVYRVMK
jgi:hypothetical protein